MSDPLALDPIRCAVFLIVAFTLAGVAQTAWFKSASSARFAGPIDGGRTFRGRRLFGPNKTWKGFVVMVPAATIVFFALGSFANVVPAISAGLWQLTSGAWALLGFIAAMGFMLAELPNSFIKRQLGVDAGGAPAGALTRKLSFVVDRLDSILGMLLAVTLTVPTSWQVWAFVLLIGPVIHWCFSVALYWLGVKARPA